MNPLEIPKLDKYINDFSGLLGKEEVKIIDQNFKKHEYETTEQIVTIFIPNRKGIELIDIGLKIFNENGIGQKELNNGLLLIIATEEKKLRIIVGKGLEIKYTEMVCRDLVENYLRPLLNEGKYGELIEKWQELTTQITNIPNGNPNQINSYISNSNTEQSKIVPFLWILLIMLVMIGLITMGSYLCGSSNSACDTGNNSSNNSSYDSSYNSDNSSSDYSSSSYDGGGGSSNGGGYGD
ncbi:TPM domain-containing protein [Candidatus Gracilibacteria bacterium]|nr:TPM domain-containing protein [Candidatus Gracilibacteria bacterium]